MGYNRVHTIQTEQGPVLISKGLRLGPTTSTEAVVGFIYATDPLRARCEGL